MPVTAGSPPPEPECEDLSLVLANIGYGKFAPTRAKLANSSATRDFLETGLSILRDDLLMHTGPDLEQGDRSRLFESLSRERILQRAGEQTRDETLTVDTYRNRWDKKGRYTEDLISYLFRLGPQRRHMEKMKGDAAEMLGSASLKDLVRGLAAAEVEAMLTDPVVSLQTIVQAALPNHPKVRQFIQAQYDTLLPQWAAIYEQIAQAYRLKLRPGFTWPDVALLFNTVIEGALARGRIDHAEPVLSNGQPLLAESILIMLPALLEGLPDDPGDLYVN
jgi:hypothetical protein